MKDSNLIYDIFRFCIALDYFRDLPLEDQVTVISRTIIELFTLHSIPHYDPIGETVRTFTGDAVDQYTMEDVTGDEFSSSLFYVLKKAMRCKMNASMASMLTCITLFSPDRDYKNELNESKSTWIPKTKHFNNWKFINNYDF